MSERVNIKEIKTRLEEVRKKAQEEARSAFNSGVKQVFGDHPKLKSFSWLQYTPYFCDGDPCEFRVNDDQTIEFDGKEFEDIGNRTFDADNSYASKYQKEARETEGLKEAVGDIKDLLSILDEKDFLDLFGDHVRVTVSAEGSTTDHYDHD